MSPLTMLLNAALLSLAAQAVPTRRDYGTHPPVCIVGAGPAGLAAAGKLQQKGIQTVMFDSQKEIGGKCQSWYDDQ